MNDSPQTPDSNRTPTRFSELWGNVETTDTIPTYVPKKISEQIIIYINGITLRLYIYDFTNNTWRYSALV